ncbi:uroporphyrinogen decarboxylase family protein [Anaerobaca lacustris]|uniref:Uroporphyrinogen decarboxylase family protein n=1 Tax=Anaerobaca lacustris TaxID=3044600 RepID=A0AAW6TXG2_9BACT|nr:uroporphyrinogen decarboxylase family protein [Sedimentisphaerales bacterium M17dextr]
MTPRQRVLAAIEHRQPDRIPVDLGSTPSSGISAIAYNKLKKHLGLAGGHTRIYDVVQQLAQPEEAVLDLFGIDVLDVGRAFNTSDDDWYDVTLADGSIAQYPKWFRPIAREDGSFEVERDGQIIARMPAGGTFFDQTCFPYVNGYPSDFRRLPEAMDKVLWSALAHSPWDHAHEPDFWRQLRERTIQLRQSSDRALMIVCGCNLFEWGTFLRRMDNFLMDLVAEPDGARALLEALIEVHLGTLERVCEAVGDVVDIIRFGDDLGMIGGPFMSPQTYRALFKPHHVRLNAYVHQHTPMKTFLHSCGSIYALLPDLIEAGYDVINPVQTNCKDMDPARLKREFGNDITFWGGGCDTAAVLGRADADEVRRHVRERLEIFAPGGGFVFNTIHNILPEVPPENVAALFEAVRQCNGM